MSTLFKNIPPRIIAINNHNQTGSYPTIKRTGDSSGRLGNFSVLFNDRRTIVFTEQTLNLPTGLPTGSLHLQLEETSRLFAFGILGPFATDATAIPYSSLVDPFLDFRYNSESITPFKEDFRIEFNSGTFYQTGSNIEYSNIGFQERLIDKRQINIDLPLLKDIAGGGIGELNPATTSMELLGILTASSYYYNSSTQKFQLPNNHATKPLLSANFFDDVALFSAIGIMTLSGTRYRTDYNGSTIDNAFEFYNVIDQSYAALNNGFLSYSVVAPTSNHVLSMRNYITEPFLLEKVIVDLPFKAGSGWFDDKTRMEQYDDGADVYSNCGGPAVTFALLRNNRIDETSYREIICSGTIIPAGDNVLGSVAYTDNVATYTVPTGFRAYGGTPTVVLSSSNSTFTGSVLLEMVPSFSVGAIMMQTSSNASNPILMCADTYGRTQNLSGSDRSYFINDYMRPEFTTTRTLHTLATTSSAYNIRHSHESYYAPYILMPDDELVLSLSKYHACTDHVATFFAGLSYPILHARHDVGVNSGTIKIKLFGSLLKDNKVKRNKSINQPLDSKAINEPIREEISDGFQLEPRQLYSGSYIDNILEGDITSTTYSTTRKIVGSLSKGYKLGATGAFQRFATYIDYSERYYDSLVPAPDDISRINGASFINYNNVFNFVHVGPGNGLSAITSSLSPDRNWGRSFPFAPEYASLQRYADPFKLRVGERRLDTSAASVVNNTRPINNFSVVWSEGRDSSGANTVDNNIKFLRGLPDASTTVPPRDGALRLYYGIGDGIIAMDLTGSNNTADNTLINVPKLLRFRAGGAFLLATTPPIEVYEYGDVEIRGWKYGLISGLSYYTTAIFSRSRFGHFADLLEQRKYSKFYNENDGKVKESVINRKFTQLDPYDTYCSNMSIEATSSLPYFDGEIRNRGSLPSSDTV